MESDTKKRLPKFYAKKDCKHCHGKGYIVIKHLVGGIWEDALKQVCGCVRVDLTEQEKEGEVDVEANGDI